MDNICGIYSVFCECKKSASYKTVILVLRSNFLDYFFTCLKFFILTSESIFLQSVMLGHKGTEN